MPAIRRLKVAVSGLGRMGARHAAHFLHRTPKAELVAAFTPDPKEMAWAKENLEPWGVKLYTDFDAMLKHEGLEAVCVATVTTVHAEQTIKAIEAGKHVLCEKPLSTKLEVVSLPFSISPELQADILPVPTSPSHSTEESPH
jgi:myo-inositol 2-dehydrogenase/D-chiro-inositol 1-dehydrogenase